MSLALNGSSVIWCFKHSNAIEICNRMTFDFYTGLLQIIYRFTKNNDNDIHIHLWSSASRNYSEDKTQLFPFYYVSLSCSLSQPGCESQLACLLSLKLPYLYSTLELFVQWVQDGIYDFHHLPLVMKKHLEDGDVETLQKIIVNYKSKYLCM